METIQATLDLLASRSDRRTSVFDIEIVRLQNTRLTLSGRLLEETQLEALVSHFRSWHLDTAAVRVLRRGDLTRMHVKTNLTGLYERPTFGMPLSSELPYGTEVEILEEEGGWVFTRQHDGYLGWAYRNYLAAGAAAPASHLLLAPVHELRARPDAESPIFTRIVSGTGVAVEETQPGWARVAANKAGWLPAALLRPLAALPESPEAQREMMIDDATRMMGVPYLWGGTSGNGIDCSGFARLLHRWVGVEIPRDADMQHAAARPVEPPFASGDLLFFGEPGSERQITHVGVSLGGWEMIHSSRRNNGVYVDNVQEQAALRESFAGAGTFLPASS